MSLELELDQALSGFTETIPASSAFAALPNRYPKTMAYFGKYSPTDPRVDMSYDTYMSIEYGNLSQHLRARMPYNPTLNSTTTNPVASDRGNGGLQPVAPNYTRANQEKWWLNVVTFDNDSFRNCYLIDPATGLTLQQQFGFGAVEASAEVATSFEVNLGGFAGNGQDGFFYIAEMAVWDELVPISDLQAYAQTGFAWLNRPTNLILNHSYALNWANTPTGDEIVDQSGFDMGYNLPAKNVSKFSLDNPFPVFLTELKFYNYEQVDIDLVSLSPGDAKLVAYAAGTPKPSDADIWNEVGAVVATPTQTLNGTDAESFSLTGLTSGTGYDFYGVQDVGGSVYQSTQAISLTTDLKYEESVISADGADFANATNINWSWFDSVDPSAFATPSDQGSAEVTDGTGLLEIPLRGISTAKGGFGTMVLECTVAGEDAPRTASHIVEVK